MVTPTRMTMMTRKLTTVSVVMGMNDRLQKLEAAVNGAATPNNPLARSVFERLDDLERGVMTLEDNVRDLMAKQPKPEVRPKVKRIGWINIYPTENEAHIHPTEEMALQARRKGCVATIKIEWWEDANA